MRSGSACCRRALLALVLGLWAGPVGAESEALSLAGLTGSSRAQAARTSNASEQMNRDMAGRPSYFDKLSMRASP